MDSDLINENYKRIIGTIENTALIKNRHPEDIVLIAVSKKQPIEKIIQAIKAGIIHLGENYPDEALEKIRQVISKNVHWHMIGHIQSRKIKIVGDYFNFVHSIDSIKTAQKLDLFICASNIIMPVLFEINIASEISKHGYDISDEYKLEEFYKEYEQIKGCKFINPRGIMVMPPYSANPEDSRKYFVKAHNFLFEFQKRYPNDMLTELSMGTSQDYMVAIEEGATMIRIGTAIFGER